MKLTKTNFLIYKDCAKNAWLKIHKPNVYFARTLSVFDQGIVETGNEVDELARDLFPGGVLVVGDGGESETKELIKKQTPVMYQPVFETNVYKIICDMLVWNSNTKLYDLYEVKASSSGENSSGGGSRKKAKDELYSYDITFQYLVLNMLKMPIGKLFLTRLNSEYVRGEELDIHRLFIKEDFTERVMGMANTVAVEMKTAQEFISKAAEPHGSCQCITRGRSAHCTTFSYSNPNIPEYSVHDITRIGQSKKRLEELVDIGIFSIADVPKDFKLSDKQRNQVEATQSGKTFIDKREISNFLNTISSPISFFDYETYPSAIPRFAGYRPFHQIPFQFSLHVFNDGEKEPTHAEFIFTENKNPDEAVIEALRNNIPESGTILVWFKPFEMGRNRELAERNPKDREFLEGLNNRIIDLMDIFTEQHFVHPGFKGKTSIKYVLPILAPELSYKELDIQEGATASDTWNKIVNKKISDEEAKDKVRHLLAYCERDTYAMYAIWKTLTNLVT